MGTGWTEWEKICIPQGPKEYCHCCPHLGNGRLWRWPRARSWAASVTAFPKRGQPPMLTGSHVTQSGSSSWREPQHLTSGPDFSGWRSPGLLILHQTVNPHFYRTLLAASLCYLQRFLWPSFWCHTVKIKLLPSLAGHPPHTSYSFSAVITVDRKGGFREFLRKIYLAVLFRLPVEGTGGRCGSDSGQTSWEVLAAHTRSIFWCSLALVSVLLLRAVKPKAQFVFD